MDAFFYGLDNHIGSGTNFYSRVSRNIVIPVTWRIPAAKCRRIHYITTTGNPKTPYEPLVSHCYTITIMAVDLKWFINEWKATNRARSSMFRFLSDTGVSRCGRFCLTTQYTLSCNFNVLGHASLTHSSTNERRVSFLLDEEYRTETICIKMTDNVS